MSTQAKCFKAKLALLDRPIRSGVWIRLRWDTKVADRRTVQHALIDLCIRVFARPVLSMSNIAVEFAPQRTKISFLIAMAGKEGFHGRIIDIWLNGGRRAPKTT